MRFQFFTCKCNDKKLIVNGLKLGSATVWVGCVNVEGNCSLTALTSSWTVTGKRATRGICWGRWKKKKKKKRRRRRRRRRRRGEEEEKKQKEELNCWKINTCRACTLLTFFPLYLGWFLLNLTSFVSEKFGYQQSHSDEFNSIDF